MIKKIFLTATSLILILIAFGQKQSIELTFTAIDSAAYVQLDSIKVINRTQGGDTVLYYPDTVLVLNYQVGIPETNLGNEGFQVFQNYPNPVADQTTVSLYIPKKGKVNIHVTDILGHVIAQSERVLNKGKHSFRFNPGNGNLYIFTATWMGQCSSIKILQNRPLSRHTTALEYIGHESSSLPLKVSTDFQSMPFSLGDELLYIGYYDTLQSGMLDTPENSNIFSFQFATNIPCPGKPTVGYEGQVYNTIQIFSQCWLKENLNVGTMIQGTQNMEDNGTIEKYCYNNEPDSCAKYGGLYQWNEMMQYTNQPGAQGLCPPGWHVPTDEEWKVLEGAVDSHIRMGDLEWDDDGFRGFDAGINLKTTSGWQDNGYGTDLFGFTGLPGGVRGGYSFETIGYFGRWWTSTENVYDRAWARNLGYNESGVKRFGNNQGWKENGQSARCISDN